MKALAIRKSQELARLVDSQISGSLQRLISKAKHKGIALAAACGKTGGTARFSAYKQFQKRLRDRGVWYDVREQLAWERFEQLYDAAVRRQVRAEPDSAQLSLPDFDRLPQIRIDGQTEFCA